MHPIATLSLLASILPCLASARWTLNDTCPTQIKTTIPNGRSEFGSMKSVHEALSNCPNITSLDLRVTLLGCSTWPDRWNLPLNYNGGETYPDVKILRLEGYDFSNRDDLRPSWQMPLQGRSEVEAWTSGLYDWLRRGPLRPWLQAQIYGYPPLPAPKSNLDLWLGVMKWSAIEELAIDNCRSAGKIQKLPQYLHSLRKLSSTNMCFIRALPNNTLESLTWIGPHKSGDLEKILEHQGASLRELEFRMDENGYPSMLNRFNVSILTRMAPNLRHLTINIPRNNTWPLDSLQVLASSPSLQSIEIYSNLQSECQRQKPDMYSIRHYEWMRENGIHYCTGADQFQKPLINESSAEELFRSMRQANSAGKLQNVTFRLGDWRRPWDGPLYMPPWIEHRQVEIECSLDDGEEQDKRCRTLQSFEYWPPEANEDGLDWLFRDVELDLENGVDYNLLYPVKR